MSKVKDAVIEKLTQEKIDLEAKISKLESKIAMQNHKLAVGSNEEELCRLEINRLYELAKNGPLEWDEIKAFDVYVKALLAIRGKPAIKKKELNPVQLSQEELLKLAMDSSDSDDNEQ